MSDNADKEIARLQEVITDLQRRNAHYLSQAQHIRATMLNFRSRLSILSAGWSRDRDMDCIWVRCARQLNSVIVDHQAPTTALYQAPDWTITTTET